MRHEKQLTTVNGEVIKLIVDYSRDIISGDDHYWVYAFLKDEEGCERLLFLPRSTSKGLNGMSLEKYKKSPERGILLHLSAGQVLKAMVEAKVKAI